MLYFLTQEQLARTLFPLGEFESKGRGKSPCRAERLCQRQKHDSQDICFVQNESYGDFIERYAGLKFPEGDFVDEKRKGARTSQGAYSVYDGSAKRSRSCPARPPLCQGKGHRAQQGSALPRKRALYKTVFANNFNCVSGSDFSEPTSGQTAKTQIQGKGGCRHGRGFG